MLSPIEQFRENIIRVRNLDGLHTALDNTLTADVDLTDILRAQIVWTTTTLVDLTDILRAQIVMIVSTLDHYIHEITRVGMLEVYKGERPQTDAFLRFKENVESALKEAPNASQSEWFDSEIRKRHGHRSFQRPDNIAKAVRLFSSCKLWQDVAEQLNLDAENVKNELIAIIDRRNKIAHEADLDPSYPDIITRWPISPEDVASTLDFIEKVCEAIHIVSNQS